ncbi:MAG TPA: class D beta-lactamase [Tianweitania sediminis]|jgi:beta-lactamase class D|nr:class D beta-lactamase [Tianweitania sediminis]
MRTPKLPTFFLAAAATLLLGSGQSAEARMICTIVADAATSEILTEEGDCQTRVTPASTFKIALAVMGFDAGVLKSTSAPTWEWKKGDPDWGGAAWRRPTDPAAWMKHSVVWYSQRITPVIGAAELSRYSKAFGYGNADFTGDPGKNNGLERAWISSSLKISPREQVAFLARLLNGKLSVTAQAVANTRAIVEEADVGGGWRLWGKTGGAFPRKANGEFDRAQGWGWFVGWAEQKNRRLVFARLIQGEREPGLSPGRLAKAQLLKEWPKRAVQLAR